MNRSLRRVSTVLVLVLLCAGPVLARTAARPAKPSIENIFSTLWDLVQLPLRHFRQAPSSQPTRQKDGPLAAPLPDGPTTNSCPPAGCPQGGDDGGHFDPNG